MKIALRGENNDDILNFLAHLNRGEMVNENIIIYKRIYYKT